MKPDKVFLHFEVGSRVDHHGVQLFDTFPSQFQSHPVYVVKKPYIRQPFFKEFEWGEPNLVLLSKLSRGYNCEFLEPQQFVQLGFHHGLTDRRLYFLSIPLLDKPDSNTVYSRWWFRRDSWLWLFLPLPWL